MQKEKNFKIELIKHYTGGKYVFTDKQVLEIRNKHKAGISRNDLAKEYNTNTTTIFNIYKLKSYAHVKDTNE